MKPDTRQSSSNSDTDQVVIKQEEYFGKECFNAVDIRRSECAQSIVNLSCQVCNATFSTRETCLEHQKIFQYHCKECKICFKKEAKYWTHKIRVHPSSDSESDTDLTFYCDSCKFTFPTDISFNRHMAIQHKVGTISLDQLHIVQDDISPTINAFNYCTRCQFTFVQRNDFFTHLVRIHQIEMELDPYLIQVQHPTLIPDLNHPHHFCNACEYTFRNRANFLQHLLKQHESSDIQPVVVDKKITSKKGICCPVCSENLPHVTAYRNHAKMHRPKVDANNDNNYCSECDRTYSDIFSFRRHLLIIHKIDKRKNKSPVPCNKSKMCDACEITLMSSVSYKRHLESARHKYNMAPLKVKSQKVNRQKFKSTRKQSQKKLKDTVAQLLKQLEHKQKPKNGIVSDLLEQLQQHQKTEQDDEGLVAYNENDGWVTQNGRKELIKQPIEQSRYKNGKKINKRNDSIERHQKYVSIKQTGSSSALDPSSIKSSVNPKIANNQTSYCSSCDIKFISIPKYNQHMLLTHDIQLSKPAVLRNHIHSNIQPDINNVNNFCTVCKLKYVRKYEFRKHLIRFHSIPKDLLLPNHDREKIKVALLTTVGFNGVAVQCIICGGLYKTVDLYNNHLKEDHCDDVIDSIYVDVCNPDKQCTACEQNLASRYGYKLHLERMHGIKVIPLDEIETDYPIISDTNDPDNWCSICKKKLASKSGYARHLQSKHLIKLPDLTQRVFNGKTPDINDPHHYCAACERWLSSKKSYTAHLVSLHGIPRRHLIRSANRDRALEINSTDNSDIIPDIRASDNMCTACDKKYHSKRNFRTHLIDVHGLDVPEAEQPETEDNLPKRKMKPIISLPGKTYTCDTCQTTFKSSDDYRYHMDLDHNIKLQNKNIYSPSWINLKTIPDLNGPKNTCTACKRKYSSYHSLRRHWIHIHNMKLPDETPKLPTNRKISVTPEFDAARLRCTTCDKVYSSKYSHRYHLRTIHNMDLPPYSVKTDPDLVNLPVRPPKAKKARITPGTTRKSSQVVKHSCSECDTTYQTKRELLIHMNFTHKIKKPEIGMLRCDECNENFYDNLLYQIHLVEGHDNKKMDLTYN